MRLRIGQPCRSHTQNIGKPIPGASIDILDQAMTPVPIGIPGEIYIGGHGLSLGYLNQPELSHRRFIPDPFSSSSAAMLFKTGDAASWNADGTLAPLGRIDDQIKRHGWRIEPGEIESALTAHPAIAQARVVCREDRPGSKQLVAYWTRAVDARSGAGEGPCHSELRSFLAPDRPVYGLRAIGLDGCVPRHTSVEQMAAHYAAQVRAFQPVGPYHLLGYSAGGWYAYAVAGELLRRAVSKIPGAPGSLIGSCAASSGYAGDSCAVPGGRLRIACPAAGRPEFRQQSCQRPWPV